MSCFNFIIMKVNGADVSNLPYEEAVQLFLNAEEPILVEVRRRCFDENNKLSFFSYDTHKSPTMAVIASSNTSNLYDGLEFCELSGDSSSTFKTTTHSINKNPTISSISCQTELSAFDSASKEILFIKGDSEFNSETFFQTKQDRVSSNTNILDGCLRTEFDIEEITLKKSQSVENLGFTISYSPEELFDSDSDSEECVDECKYADGKEEAENNLNVFGAQKCKIYVSHIVPNSLADRDGRLRQGDQILQINGQHIPEKIDPNKLLSENKSSVTILVSRYAYVGEDDFLDSAVYCDDKECQNDRHLSSICGCEQNTFSSKSSISHCEQKSCTPATLTNIYPILPIAVDKVSNLFSHASIKAQLESVNKEISLLNSQISIMKLHERPTEKPPAAVEKQLSPLPPKDRSTKNTTIMETGVKKTLGEGSKSEIEIEHIYETIAEDTDSDAYYCSPYEAVNEMRVEQWLKSIEFSKSQIQSGGEKCKNEALGLHPVASRLQKYNQSLDDYDNSSSAYNTGGSCNSALLALDQQCKPTLVYQMDRHNSRKLASKCKNVLHGLHKQAEAKDCETLTTFGKPLRTSCRNPNLSTSEKPLWSSFGSCRTPVPSTSFPISTNCPTDADSDSHSTLVARSSVYTMCQYKTVDECQEGLSKMRWKVKRRPDGTRYIVRRVVEKCPPTENNTEDSYQKRHSAAAIDFKRQVQKVKERRYKRKNSETPSKDKHDAQHWLV